MTGKRAADSECGGLKKIAKKSWTRAVCFGYLGTGYHGSQKQTGSPHPTIEGAMEKAMIEAGAIQEGEKWTRAARTDKGVHAVANLVTVTSSVELDEEKIKEINEKLTNIKVFFTHKVVNRFDARLQCDRRRYEYIVSKNIIPQEGSRNFLENFKMAFAEFKGTHNFHNFTSGIQAKDPQAMRYIISSEIVDIDEKFFKVVLLGQSFLFNQIRKLVSCAIECGLGRITVEEIRKYLQADFKKNLRMAPAEGLLLDRLFYESYDEYKCNFKDILPIGWSLKESERTIEEFKRGVIYPQVMRTLPDVLQAWVNTLDDVFPDDEDQKQE